MTHRFIEGTVYHKRFVPKTHEFTYGFFMLDIDVSDLAQLKNGLFSQERWNIMSFFAKDHFGNQRDFRQNIATLLAQFDLQPTPQMRFLTLPRIFGFVFNPLSALILFHEGAPTVMLAEVHNYNGGRIVYRVDLAPAEGASYYGSCPKDMYVSPFFDRTGHYAFKLGLTPERLQLSVMLYEAGVKSLVASLDAVTRPFDEKTIRSLLWRHTWLTLWVVTRTLWQSLQLKLKGLSWHSATPVDQWRRY